MLTLDVKKMHPSKNALPPSKNALIKANQINASLSKYFSIFISKYSRVPLSRTLGNEKVTLSIKKKFTH